MARWKRGQEIYEKLISNLGEYISEQTSDSRALAYAKSSIPEFIDGLTVKDLNLIHEYLSYRTEITPDIRTPTYVYSGGDRIAAVTRHLQKNIDLELAKCYA